MKNFLLLICVCVFAAPVFAQEAAPPKKLRVLLVTGEDYPGHLWRDVCPLIRNNLNLNKDIDCRLTDDLEILAADVIFDYDVLVCYFKNYSPLKRDAAAKKNLAAFVENGGGLALLHFTCGAFEDWAEYEKLAGRVWNPKLRGHDPYGKFTVNYTDKEHPITKDLSDFETPDELYTCLKASEVPIHVLAESTSKVDGKRYPMAFTLQYGKGKVFHTTLGHDVKSITPDFDTLLYRAVLWLGKR
ncbi:MAG: ThuA domain-containing protein [Planctomycetaceae bacterium]|jgi:type 1 glutamine amidotransferase|nr:ThuA domain-containing protein [Planctomycetaceae bacterium]